MKPPFKLPVRVESFHLGNPVLVAADCELICELEGATPEEGDYIVMCINNHELLRGSLAHVDQRLDEIQRHMGRLVAKPKGEQA